MTKESLVSLLSRVIHLCVVRCVYVVRCACGVCASHVNNNNNINDKKSTANKILLERNVNL